MLRLTHSPTLAYAHTQLYTRCHSCVEDLCDGDPLHSRDWCPSEHIPPPPARLVRTGGLGVCPYL
eukprot:5884609-Pyramimonas_sp.AAC.1